MRNFNPFFINTNICLEEKDIATSEAFDHGIVHNTGNSYIAYALMKILFGGVIKPNEIKNIYTYDFSQQDKDIDFINNSCSHVFFILQDQIRISESYGLRLPFNQLNTFLRKIHKPIIVIGLGSNSFFGFDKEFHTKLDAELVSFLNVLSDKCETIGVRGYYTAEILNNLKIRNVAPVGCPSFFETGRDRIIVKKAYSEDIKVAITPAYRNEMIPAPHYILQDEFDIVKLICFNEILDPNSITSPINAESLIQEKYRIFSDIDGWKEYLKGFDFFAGLRVHGAIVALNSGVPAVIMNPDSRAREMSELFKIPYMPELMEEQDISKIYELADYTEMNKVYNDLYDNFIKCLNTNGIYLDEIHRDPSQYIQQPKLRYNSRDEIIQNLINSNLINVENI